MNPSGNNTAYNYNAPNGTGDIKGYNPDYTQTFGTQNQNAQNFNQNQANQVGAFQGSYNAAAQALPTFQQLNQQANQQYNVPNLQNTATQLNNQVLQIPQTYSQATQGSDTNNNQLMQLIGQKQWELSPLAQAATNSAQTAQGLANTSVGYGVQNEQQLLSPYANTAPLVQSQLASAASNFGAQQQAELAALTAKMQSGVALTQTEQNNLNALQIAQQGYQNAIQVANITGQYALANTIQGQKYISQGQPGSNLINTVAQQYINPSTGRAGSY